MIAGLEDITKGDLKIDGEVMNKVHPKIVISQWFSKTMRYIHKCRSLTIWLLD
ncbi:hypothetical protein S101258_00678 [Lactiplantibacillus plantarum subsp. plantarum]|uniref:Uncharacterized protein n=1 Tax=Lactiplantibacillus plantarum subsp. plantarum TaxID=337330 RepID=A0A2S3U934_LACPN|nr:hypothetical protein S101258_00678 [Lactiplantibacillus plantarum subsp. plantarum]